MSTTAALFLANKLRVRPLEFRVSDTHLRDHFLSTENVYLRKCLCNNHSHEKKPCFMSADPACRKCGVQFTLLITYQALMFHAHELQSCRLYKCCTHIHYPPCNRCINCKTGNGCVVTEPFECRFTTSALCDGPGEPDTHATEPVDYNIVDHLYDLRETLFYFCRVHKHVHVHQPDAECCIQMFQCCERAVNVVDLDQSFIIVTGKKEYIVYDPSLWREQSKNHFQSLVRAFVNCQKAIVRRYDQFQKSNFKVPSIKEYKSGKSSIVRTAITGFSTRGIYQTTTISCDLPQNEILLPQRIWNLMHEEYDLSLVCLKRDPCIKSTCMFVCKAVKNPDPDIDVVIINDSIARPMNQDQDGDKNAVYALPRYVNRHYDRFESFLHKLSKYEMTRAYGEHQTLIGLPRYSFSENARLLIYRNSDWLLKHSEFYRRTHRHGLEYMIEAGCGYLRNEYTEFCQQVRHLNANNNTYCLTVRDLMRETSLIMDVVKSEAKGYAETLGQFFDKLNDGSHQLSDEHLDGSIEQMNRYISSGQQVRQDGRERFILIYSESELKVSFGTVFLNTKPYADFKPMFSTFAFMFNEASLNECVNDAFAFDHSDTTV